MLRYLWPFNIYIALKKKHERLVYLESLLSRYNEDIRNMSLYNENSEKLGKMIRENEIYIDQLETKIQTSIENIENLQSIIKQYENTFEGLLKTLRTDSKTTMVKK